MYVHVVISSQSYTFEKRQKMPAGKMSELEYDLGRLGDAPILPYIIGWAFPIGELGLPY